MAEEVKSEEKPVTSEMVVTPESGVKSNAKTSNKSTSKGAGKLAVVLVRGMNKVKTPIKNTIKMLNLSHANQCVIIENNSINIGMLKKVKDYLTWGEVDDTTLNELVEKRGEEFKARAEDSKGKIKYKKYFEHKGKKVKKTFRLNPPRKGFGRKGIKVPFTMKGALGYRGEAINDLLKRMI